MLDKYGGIIWLALAVLAAPLALPSCGAEGSLVMFAGYEQRTYAPGEPVNFTLHVFHNGEAVSVVHPPEVAVLGSSGTALYDVAVFESGRGHYTGRYTVLAADIGQAGTVRLMAMASFAGDEGTSYETARARMDIQVELGIEAEPLPNVTARLLDSTDSPVLPGTKLAFECCVTLDGRPADPDGLGFWMRHSVPWPGDADRIKPQRIGPGSYIVRYEVPRQNQSDRFFLDAGWANTTVRQYTGAQVALDLYQVVYHELGRTGTRVDYELLVCDRKGAPVNGSSVSLSITPGRSGTGAGPVPGSTVVSDIGRTKGNGRVRSLLDLGGAGDVAYISGWANTSRFHQRFFGAVVLFGSPNEPATVPDGGFQVVRTGMEGEAAPGATVRLDYKAFSDGRPLGDAPVDCYIQMSKKDPYGASVVWVTGQRLLTDDQGRFVINLSFPSGWASFAQATLVGPEDVTGQRANVSDAILAEPRAGTAGSAWVNATMSRAGAGRTVTVSVRGQGLAAASAGWRIDHGPSGSEQRQWSAWTSMEWPLRATTSSGGPPLRGGIALPSGLRPGLNISIGLRLANSSGELSDAAFPMRVRPPLEPANGSDLCCLAIAAVVNIALFAFVLYQYKNAKKAPPQDRFGDRQVDERIGDILLPPGGPPQGAPALPFKAELVQSVDCAVCGRKIARGNTAWGCACGRKFHEHCLEKLGRCAFCGREWKNG